MATIRVQATGSGRIVGWSELKQGRLVDTSRLARLFFTTTLTDVITDLCALAKSLDKGYRIVTVVPNGPTTAALDFTQNRVRQGRLKPLLPSVQPLRVSRNARRHYRKPLFPLAF